MKSRLNLQMLTERPAVRLFVVLVVCIGLAVSLTLGLRRVHATAPAAPASTLGTFTATIAELSSDPTSLSPVQFSVTFGEAIDPTSFVSSDVTLAGTGSPTTVAITEIAPNNHTTYRLDVSGMSGTGLITVNIGAGKVLNVGATNANSASTPTSGGNIIRWVNCAAIPATISDGDVSSLDDAITCANQTTANETITLTAGGTYNLASAFNYGDRNDSFYVPIGHATINEGTLTINGNGASFTKSIGNTGAMFEVLSGGNLTLNNIKITNVGGGSHGGGVYIDSGGTATISGCTLSGDTGSVGGAVYNNGTVKVIGSTLSGNSATTGNGGALFNSGASATMTIANSTISGNTASGSGGGIENTGSGTLRIFNSTITGNTGSVGDGINGGSSATTLYNTILIGNNGGDDCAGTISANYSIFGVDAQCPANGTNNNQQVASAGTVINTTLANNGGWGLTHALSAGSSATNAGNDCVLTDTCSPALGFALLIDQRGATRKSGTAVDIGATEIAPFVTNSPAGTALNNALADSGDGSLRQEIVDAGAGETVLFDPAFFNVQQIINLTSAELLINKNLTIDGGSAGVTVSRSGVTQFRIFNIASGVTATLSKLTISNGSHASQAGGIQNNGTLTMTDCAVTGNTSPQAGGIENDSVLTMTGCTLSGNTSTGPGGALVSFGTSNTLTNCTISGNQASSHGGGFYMSAGNLNLTNCTVASNQSTGGTGGGIYVGGTALLKNTIVSQNTASSSANIGGNNLDPASSYNFIGSGSGGLANGVNGNQITGASPGLDVLANNGGYTQSRALLTSSPALDKGAAAAGVTTDQRGQLRPFDLPSIAAATGGDNSDIGAYELQVACSAVTVSPGSLSNGTLTVGYAQTITASGGIAPYTFAVSSGTLPDGLTLGSDGTLSGIPTATGTFNFTVTATYTTFGLNCPGSQAYTITIASCGSTPTLTVNNLGDAPDATPGDGVCATSGAVCTLRAAVQEINALSACDNVINFSVTGTISMSTIGDARYGSSALGIDRKLTINGNGIVIERNSGVTRLRLFYVSPVGNLTLNDVTLQNGVALGGNGGNGNANGNGENAGAAAGLGGAIFNEGTLNINRSTLTGNLAKGGTGGSSTVFAGPAGGAGGGGMGSVGGGGGGTNGGDGGPPNGGTGSVTSGTAGGNGGAGGGGGGGKGSANGGNGGFGGGGGASGSGGFGGNGGFGGGGGSGSSAGGGHNVGGFGANDGGGNTEGGGGAGFGGAVFNNYQGVITITNSTVSGNTVTGGTGGLNQTTLASVAFALGSGLFNRNGAVTIVSSTLNDSVYNLGAANTDTGSGTSRSGGAITLFSNIITTCDNNSGTVTGPLANRNLIQNNSGCDTPALTGNPNLGALQNNGGLTPTHMLIQPSIAIDAGDNSVTGAPYNLTTDQRGSGFPRNTGGTVDIGSYENLITINPAILPNAPVGVFYNQTITATGGTAPYSFAQTGGSLPGGMSLSAGGVLSGTPSSSGGPFNFTVTATDSSGKTASRTYSTVTNCGTISSTPASLPNAATGVGYTQSLSGNGGTAPYTFAISGGSLPSGFSLSSAGVLSGNTSDANSFNFTVTITDVNGCSGTQAYSLTVTQSSCAAITVTTNADSGAGSLRQAIADICGGGIINIQSGLGVISLSSVGDSSYGESALFINNKTIVINGNGAIIERLSSVNRLRLFYVNPLGKLTLQTVTLRNGKALGGNGASAGGGGGGGAAGLGGAILNDGELTVANSTLSGNLAQGGNGGTSGSGNNGGGGGGLSGNGSVTTGGGPNGGAANGGAGGFGGGGGGLTGTGLANGGNGGFGGGGGGGYFNPGCGNPRGGGNGGFGGGGASGANGGGFGASEFGGGSGAASINCSDSGAGGGAGFGGAVFNNQGTVSIINSTLSDNTAQGGNGGTSSSGQPAANGGSGFGAGVFNRNGSVTTVNATLAFNTVTGGTGATIGTTAGGAIYNYQSGATLTLLNSILSNTVASGNDCTNDSGAVTAAAANKNLIVVNSGCGTPAVTSDPLLDTLQNNGGFSFTRALQAGSPAINVGNNTVTGAPYNLSTDQRGPGFARLINGTVDIGAYESTSGCAAITLSPPSLPDGTTGVAYTNNITASGGTAPYGFAVTTGSTPTGLTLNSDGTWSGTPSAAGTFNFTVTATDNNGCTGSQVYSVAINAPVVHHFAVSNIGSPQTAGASFNITITARDSNNNTVPSFAGTVGLSSTAGSISPTISGAFTGGTRTENVSVTQSGTGKTITVDDGSGHTGTSNSFTINAGTLDHFAIGNISSQTVGSSFNIMLTAQDVNNNTVTGFVATVNLSTTAGTISPTTSTAFTAGILNQAVTVSQAGTGRTITADDGGGHIGTSNNFTVSNSYSWNGSTSNNWNTAANWTPSVVPSATNDVDVPASGVTNDPSLSAGITTVNNLTIATNRTLTLNQDLNINGVLTLSGGNVNVGSGSTLVIGVSGSVSRTAGQVFGAMKKIIGGAGSFTFPVGTANGYSPVDALITAGNGNLSVEAVQGVQPVLSSQSSTSLQRYWKLSGTGVTVNLTFNYLAGDVMGAETSYKIFRIAGATPSVWPNSAPDTVNHKATASGVSSFSDWTLATPNGPTAASADISGRIITSDGQSIGGVVVSLSGGRERRTISDSNGNFHFSNVETDGFYTVTPSLVNYSFGPASRSFSLMANKTDAVFTANATAVATANPLDMNEYFVRQQYLDFFGREPDQEGLDFWSARLYGCETDVQCLRQRRIDVSAAFFMSEEFQQTGSFIYRLYRVSFGGQPTYAQFTNDRRLVVAGPNLEESKTAFVAELTSRADFAAAYPSSMSNSAFVLQLFDRAGLVEQTDAQQHQITALDNGATRTQVLRDVIEIEALRDREYNPSFVLMQYFGYLHRDADQNGYGFWLNALNNSGAAGTGNYRGMVCSFITATEYQQRFSPVVTHSNTDCGQ
jgi:hypothetical protein